MTLLRIVSVAPARARRFALRLFRRPALLMFLTVAAAAGPSPALAGDVAGSRDSPLVSRYAGSEIVGYVHSSYGALDMPTGPATKTRTFPSSRHAEGELWRIIYMDPADRSPLEVFRNYQQSLRKAGFTLLYSCDKDACGRNFNELIYPRGDKMHNSGAARDAFALDQDRHYLAAELANDKGVARVALYVARDGNAGYNYKGPGRTMTYLQVVKGQPMETNMVKVDAAAMARGIAAKGHVAVYGVYFDTDKAILKPGSAPALEQMAKLLRDNPALKVYVVGHTDNVGTLDYNLGLSAQRAEAVTHALETTYRIAPSRLTAKGVGPLAPIASNQSEAGRAKNRRVELVRQ